MKRLSLLTFAFLISASAFGASLKGTADALGQEAIKIGIALGAFAIVSTFIAGNFQATTSLPNVPT